MAKTSGGVRSLTTNGVRSVSTRSSVEKKFQNDAREYFDGIATSYGRPAPDYSGHDLKTLKHYEKIGRNYDPSERTKAIADYVKWAMQRTNGEFRSIEHASLEGARSELIRVANRANIHSHLDAMRAEIKRRKGR